jgi:hypothetical protein
MTAYGTITWRKARRSGQNGNCVEVAAWRKAQRSGQNGNCVEVNSDGTTVLIRDSKYLRDSNKDPATQPIIAITAQQWLAFLAAVTEREVGPSEPAIKVMQDGSATLTAIDGTTLNYTAAEWEAFSLGAGDGEFDDLSTQAVSLSG